MSSGRGQISTWLSFSILILSAGLVSHVMAIPVILGVSGRDSWVAVLVAAPIFLIWIFLIFGIVRALKGQRLPDWIDRQFGIVPAWMFRLSAVVVLFISGSYTLHDTSMWTVTTYMQQTPLPVIIVAAALISMMAAYGGIKSIAMTASILLPLVLLLGYFVMSSNMKFKDYSRLLPAFENGWQPVGSGLIYVLAALLEAWILLLYQHELKSKLRWWHVLLLGLFLVSMTLGPTIGAIAEFGPAEAAKQRHTAFEQWKLLTLGTLFQHVDFMSIYQWLCGAFARVSITLYLIVDMLDVRRPRKRLVVLSIVTLAMIVLSMLPWRDDETLAYLQYIHFPALLIYVVGITLLLGIASLISRWKESRRHDLDRSQS
ncbi:endospore germination permease [Paenibacillus sp. NPDC057967]|uniref:GerAB/ArcD/ProY family transporter n=1 Tax=Paenibacillus sp. NPDC057967 TaxID=3346293 RepID=UPI0036DE89D8